MHHCPRTPLAAVTPEDGRGGVTRRLCHLAFPRAALQSEVSVLGVKPQSSVGRGTVPLVPGRSLGFPALRHLTPQPPAPPGQHGGAAVYPGAWVLGRTAALTRRGGPALGRDRCVWGQMGSCWGSTLKSVSCPDPHRKTCGFLVSALGNLIVCGALKQRNVTLDLPTLSHVIPPEPECLP